MLGEALATVALLHQLLCILLGCDALPFAKGKTPMYLCHSLDQ
jgi:hypothetical protein